MPEVREVTAASILTPQKVGSLSGYYDYSLNPYAGCAFGCSYCYVPKFPNARHEYWQWGKWLEVKVNAPQLIRRDRTMIFGSRIFFSSATDPYQYAELKYRLSRRCLEELLLYQPARVTMHTRSHLILQDLELLKKFGETLEVGVSLTTDDDDVRREFEPQAPSIKRRLNLVRALHEAGIDVYVSMSPLLPCNPERLAQLVAPYADRVWVDNMRWTEVNTSPELIEKYSAHFEPDNHAQVTARLKTQFFKERSELALASQEQDDSDDAHAHEHELEPQTKTDRPPARASKARSRARMSSKRTRQGSAQMNTPANRPSQTQQLRLFDLR